MKRFTAYIDGQAGTTGLQIESRLSAHPDVEILTIEESRRKDAARRRELLNEADVAFLCLPDDAAREAASLVENQNAVLIDASTAHRTAPGWDYGFAELSKAHRENLTHSKRIANPGCHASGFVALAYPLVACGIAASDYPFSCFSVTGYSGGGKKMIAEYEAKDRPAALSSPRQYGLNQLHKHLPEMQRVCGLAYAPAFSPVVSDYYAGMAVSVPVFPRLLNRRMTRQDLLEFFSAYYGGQQLLTVSPENDGMLAANARAGENGMTVYVLGNDERVTLLSLFDNLGKGASGAAVQNMNLALGLPECRSLKGTNDGTEG